MSNFSEHIRYGWITHAIISIFLIPVMYTADYTPHMIISIIGITLPLTLVASILPDIDHRVSNTNTLFRYLIFVTSICSLTVLAAQNKYTIYDAFRGLHSEISTGAIIITISCIIIIIGYSILKIIKHLRPKHRGFTHSIIFIVFITIIVGLLSARFYVQYIQISRAVVNSIMISGLFIGGLLSHIALDKI